jgi:ribosomal protein S12 methylthiotransferase
VPDRRPRAKIVTLGCPKNEVDSEEIAGVLVGEGYQIVGAEPKSDVTIVNTCGFVEAATEESLKAIRDAVREKRAGRTKRVIVAGCLTQRLGADLLKLAPGADLYVGLGQMGRFGEIVRKSGEERHAVLDVGPPTHRWAAVETRARTGKPWSAYLKISEGCDHECAFCTIPSFRGPHVSKPPARVVDEARYLVATGAKELCIIAQDVTQYGFDIDGKFGLPGLLRDLDAVEGIEWVRLLYLYPTRLNDELIGAMSGLSHVLPYVDIPLQHAHPDVLRRMKRPWDGERYLGLLEKVRRSMPDVAVRSTFIVGYPGETDEEFQYLLEFLESARMDRVGAFIYSREAGTPAHDMPDQVSGRVKRERYGALMRLQQRISLEVNASWVGRRIRVMVDETGEDASVARSFRDAPEIDGLVYLDGRAQPGSIVDVEITGAEPYDLAARLVS